MAVGCAATSPQAGGGYFYGLAVKREWQRKGIGGQLMQARLEGLRAVNAGYAVALVMFWNSRFFRRDGFAPFKRGELPLLGASHADLKVRRSAFLHMRRGLDEHREESRSSRILEIRGRDWFLLYQRRSLGWRKPRSVIGGTGFPSLRADVAGSAAGVREPGLRPVAFLGGDGIAGSNTACAWLFFQPHMWSVRVSRVSQPDDVFWSDEMLRAAIRRSWSLGLTGLAPMRPLAAHVEDLSRCGLSFEL